METSNIIVVVLVVYKLSCVYNSEREKIEKVGCIVVAVTAYNVVSCNTTIRIKPYFDFK